MVLPHLLLYFPWRRKGAASSRNAAKGVACSLLFLFWQGVVGGKAWAELWGRDYCWKRKFQCSTTYSSIHSSSSIWFSRVATAVLPFLSVLSQEKAFSQATLSMSDQSEVLQACSQWVYLCWMVLVSIGHSWVLYLAPTCPLRGSRSFDLVQATYKCHHTTGMSESS